MSRRLLQRGRYPKGPGVQQITNTNSQFSQNPPAAQPQMPLYDPNLQPQTGQNSWSQPPYTTPNTYQPNQVNHHPVYPDPNTYQLNQVPHQPVPEPAAYWSGSQMHPAPSQPPWNESWNYKSENPPDNSNYANYQQPAITTATEQWQQQAPYSEINNQTYPPLQPVTSYDPTYDQGYHHSTPEYQTTNTNSHVIPPNSTPPWENGGIEATQSEQLSWTYGTPQYSNPSLHHVQDLSSTSNSVTNTTSWSSDSYAVSSNLDYNVSDNSSANYLYANSDNLSAASSENVSPNSSPSVEQIKVSETISKDLQSLNINPISENNSQSNEQSELEYASSTLAAFFQNPDQEEISTQPENVSTDSVPLAVVKLSSQEDVSATLGLISVMPDISGTISNPSDIPQMSSNTTDAVSVISNHSDDSRDISSKSDASMVISNLSAASRVIGNQLDPRVVANQSDDHRGIANHPETLGLINSQPYFPGTSLEEQENASENENNFLQEERILGHNLEENQSSSSISPTGFIEEPINQEVPEPHQNESSIGQPQCMQDYQEIISEDPPNQQVPTRSGQTSRSTSSERERVVIRPREDSPFKPPRPSSTKGIVVQQEISIPNHAETKLPEGKTVVQEVNLETFPDNLERPSDYEELRKQSPLYVSHKYLRSELNSSPSSLLCDNLDIPCVTLAPAAPPLSSAKSDRSQSSTDSKSEGFGEASCNPSTFKLNESNRTGSSCNVQEEDSYKKSKDQHMSKKETSNAQLSRSQETAQLSTTKKYDNAPSKSTKEETFNAEKNDLYQPMHLKDSKVNGSSSVHTRDSQSLRQAVSNSDIPETRMPPSRNPHRDPKFHSDERIDASYGSDHSESGRQRFADQKYPSYDERQYYSDRERSRPSSRTSLRERPEDFPFQPKPGAYPYQPKPEDYPYQPKPEDYPYQPNRGDPRRYPPTHGRPSSRMSNESEARHSDRQGYYGKQYAYPSNTYPRNPDYYQRSPNQRGYERDYDPYQRDPYYSYDAQRYSYSNYNYGFYDEFFRNDPRYKQYQEQWQQYQEQCRQYQAKYGHAVDYERSSAHSGRSSIELAKEGIASGHYREPDIDSNESEFSGYNLDQNYSYDDGQNEISNTEADQASTPSSRLTPMKFSYAHPIARFSPGGLLITAIPNQLSTVAATTVRIHNLQVIREDEDSFKELKSHQGPLVRGLTHKNDVIEFCTQKIKAIKSIEDIVDRDSYTLLWDLMVLLLRQNGSVAGSDIAELLLKDHEVLRPPTLALKQAIDTPLGEHSPADVNDSSSQSHAGDTSSPDEGIVVLHDKTLLNTSRNMDVDKITRKFREFLLFGHKKDALEWAMKHGLWGHALFLASKMDLRTYANVMTRFANSLALNDPLQTLYQLMSGRQPLAVTNVADKKWGDWRPHLAMILSNPSSHPDVDSRSITTLGDTLASKGCLCAAHFCYIMAQVEFGTYEQKSSKLVLLTSDHSLPFEEFASNEAIQVTEIYEYAQSLANPSYLLVHVQSYKLLYAKRLVEHGFLEEALHYCEIIAGKLQEHPHFFQLDFVTEVFKLATLLKYHDPHFLRGQGEFEDQDDPDWLINLATLVQNFNNFPVGEQPQPYVEQQQAEVNQNQSASILQFTSQPTESIPLNNVPNQVTQNEVNNSYNQMNYYPQSGWNPQNSLQNSNFSSCNISYQEAVSNQSSFHRQNSLPSHEENETTDVPSSPVTQTPPFDYFSGGAQQVHESRSIYETSNSYNNLSERERRDSAMSSGSRYSQGSTSVANKSSGKESKSEAKKDKHTTQAGSTWLGGIFSRFILPKAPNQMILPDDKNPTIVWDDVKNCWVNKDSNDEDESSAPLAPPTDMELMGSKSSITTFHSPGSSMPPSTLAAPGSSVPPASMSMPANKFQRPKTRGMRQNYVDVLNSSGATKKTNILPESLFPTPYESGSSPQMFIPTPTSTVGENSTDFEPCHSTYSSPQLEREEPVENQATPLMFDPAAFDSRKNNANSQRHTLGQAGRRTYPT